MNDQPNNKMLKVLGMLGFLILALSTFDLAAGLKVMNSGNQVFYGFFFVACFLSAGIASFLYGFQAFMPVERQGWIRKKFFSSAVVSVLLFLFLAVSFPGSHQNALRVKDSETQFNLSKMVKACHAYWKEKGVDKVCDLTIAARQEYGFVPSEHVTINGKGTAKNFNATARHAGSSNRFTANAQGTIKPVGNRQR